jgi:hypothetical protein
MFPGTGSPARRARPARVLPDLDRLSDAFRLIYYDAKYEPRERERRAPAQAVVAEAVD